LRGLNKNKLRKAKFAEKTARGIRGERRGYHPRTEVQAMTIHPTRVSGITCIHQVED